MKRSYWPLAIALLAAPVLVTTGLSRPAAADLVAVANDNHSVNVDGKMEAAKSPPPDNVAFIDVSQYPPKLVATVDAPTSVVGAPTAVWLAPDESWAIVTAATKIDPNDPSKIVDDDTVSVIDLKASPPKVVQTLHAGKGANEISVDSDLDYALVANRAEGTISAYSVGDKRLTGAGKIDLGNPKSMPSSLKFTPDAENALVTLYGENAVGWLKIAEAKTTVEKHQIVTGVSPYTLDINKAGTLAAVANMGGGGSGDIGTVSLIDLTRNPPATVETYAVPASPEGLKFSPDGRFLAVASVNGTTQPKSSPIYHDNGRLWLLAIQDGMLKPLAEAPIGRWSQGIAFSKDGKTILVESMIDHGLNVFRWDGKTLTAGQTLETKGAPAAIRSSWP